MKVDPIFPDFGWVTRSIISLRSRDWYLNIGACTALRCLQVITNQELCMNRWQRGDELHYPGGSGTVIQIQETEGETPIIVIESDDGVHRTFSADAEIIQPKG